MRKLFILLACTLNTGCYTIHTGTGIQRGIMLQVGVVVRVVNNCAPSLTLETPGGVVVKDLPYSGSITVPLQSVPFTGTSRSMDLTAKGFTQGNEYLGSTTRTFYVDTYSGSRQTTWEVDYLRLPDGRGGCVR